MALKYRQWSQAGVLNAWPAPILFNLYAALIVERWKEKVEDVEGAGIVLNYKLDESYPDRTTGMPSKYI